MPDHPRLRSTYDVVLVLLAGSTLGWFGWWFLGGYGSGSGPALWLWEAAGVALAWFGVRWLRGRRPEGRSRAVHLLWIPVVLFVLLMIAVIMALRNFT